MNTKDLSGKIDNYKSIKSLGKWILQEVGKLIAYIIFCNRQAYFTRQLSIKKIT